MNPHDTIAAVSSPPGRSLRGLLRISGANAFPISQQLVSPPSRALTSEAPKGPISRTHLRDPSLPVFIAFFRGPHSYTGDDTAELQLPGHPALLERILHQCFALGARPAEPGEFTYRAWKNGKLDLLEAEGIAALIAARSDAQLDAAHALHQRQLGRVADQLAATLTDQLALVEAGIDFTDQEDVVPIPPDVLHQRLLALDARLADALQHARAWSALDALPRVVLAGHPSVGKSTLFNALLNRPRAVVDAAPGTTRDALEEPTHITPDHEILLIDLAGLDAQLQTSGGLDHAAQQAAQHAIAHADLVLELVKHPHTPPLNLNPTQPRLRLQTHADQPPPTHHPGLVASATSPPPPPIDLQISAHTGHNLPALRALIAQQLSQLTTTRDAEALTLQPRHLAALTATRTALQHAAAAIDPHAHALALPELVADHLRHALDHLGQLAGHTSPDDVIGRVFATFCVGK